MPGIGDLLGRNGVIEQLLLWNVVGRVVEAMMEPAFTLLTQDAQAAHPEMVLSPDVLAQLAVREFVTLGEGRIDAAKSGISPDRFDYLVELSRVHVSPGDLATAVLRSYMAMDEAEAEARPQGISQSQLQLLTDLAGDAPGPDQIAAAYRRGIIPEKGAGVKSVSYEQGIRESRLHDKWAPVLLALSAAILSPPDAAEAVVRGFISRATGAHIARMSGVDADTFDTMVELAGDAPGPEQLAEALRRELIPEDSGDPAVPGFVQGIMQGRLADKWAPMIKGLSQIWPSPVDALQAVLEGQVSDADGRALYAKLGGAPEFYDWQYNTRGSAPTPLELIDMARREIIQWDGVGPKATTYEQGFLEGPWRNKWAPVYRQYAEYLPDVSTVVELLSHGSMDSKTAAGYLKQQGLSPELISAYLDEAHTEALSDYRGATVSMVLQAYHDQILAPVDATNILEALHVTPQAVELMLAYEDAQRAFEQVNAAVSRIRSLYAARKITEQTVTDSLGVLGVPAAQVPGIVASWQLENSISVKPLTETQIIDAWSYSILTDDECSTELQNIGYTPFDAWVLMSVKAKAALPGKPALGPAPPQSQVIPGTT